VLNKKSQAYGAPGSLLFRALEKVRGLSPVSIEVLMTRSSTRESMRTLLTRLWERGLFSADQIVIFANPTTRRAGVWVGPHAQARLKAQEWEEWVYELEQDLHQTHPDRALAFAVMSLGLALHSIHQR
jgi:hypothetical protein